MLPEVGKKYWHYDDGKIRPSRQETVVINKILPFSEISEELRNKISKEIEEYDWIYNNIDDYFDTNNYIIFATNLDMIGHPWDKGDEEIIYLLDKKDKWYGFGVNCYWNQGQLDVDGKLTEEMLKYNNYKCSLFPED